MKKYGIIFLALLIALPATSQGRRYKKKMLQGIEAMDQASSPEEVEACVEQFDKIAGKYPDQWLPYYYAAHILTTHTLGEQDISKGDERLDRAQVYLDSAMSLAPGESEVHVLNALHIIARLSLDAYTRGQFYYNRLIAALQEAENLNPENPRVYYLNGMLTLNTPYEMGGGDMAAKPLFQKAAEKFSGFDPEDPLWPSWGADLNQQELDKL